MCYFKWFNVASKREKIFPTPAQGSLPILICFPSPTFHVVQFPTKGKVSTKSIHPIESFLYDFSGSLNHSAIEDSWHYLDLITFPHRDKGDYANIHSNLAAKNLQNRSKFLNPHPPNSLGFDSIDHLIRGMPSSCLLVVQRKKNNFFLSFFKIPFGM